MKMLIVNPLKMQWEAKYREIFPDAEWSEIPRLGYDTYLFMWCNNVTQMFINDNAKQGRYIVFIRRYEYYSNLEKMQWDKVDAVIMVNDWLAEGFKQRTGVKPYVIYNGVDPDKWTFRERAHGNQIAWVGFVNQKKNIPLALQILAKLPEDYELHIAGGIQCFQTWDYLTYITKQIKRKVTFNGHIPHEYMNQWLEDKNYILSTAISEGCPNHVIEAMAKGIKPVVHNWAGSREQFDSFVFTTTGKAIHDISNISPYDSERYRSIVSDKFGINNYEKVRQIVCGQ